MIGKLFCKLGRHDVDVSDGFMYGNLYFGKCKRCGKAVEVGFITHDSSTSTKIEVEE